MSDLPSAFSDFNPEGRQIIGQKATNLTRNILQSLDLSQHKPQDILDALRENNINITIPSFYNAYNEITGSKTRSQRIKYVNQQYIPSDNVLEPALYPLQTRYRIVHLITYQDLDTGLEIKREYVIDTDTLSSIGDMQSQAIDAIQSRYNVAVIDISTIRGYIYKG